MYISNVSGREVQKRQRAIPPRQRGEFERVLDACGASEDDLEAPDPDNRVTAATHLELEEKLALEYVARMSGLSGAGALLRLLARGFLGSYRQPKPPTPARARKRKR